MSRFQLGLALVGLALIRAPKIIDNTLAIAELIIGLVLLATAGLWHAVFTPIRAWLVSIAALGAACWLFYCGFDRLAG